VISWRPLTVLQEFDAMTAPSSIDAVHFLHEQLAQASLTCVSSLAERAPGYFSLRLP
jgi:hypothetical protein